MLCRNIDCTLQCDVTYVVKTDLYLLVVSPWVALNSTCDNLGRNHHRTATDPVGNKCTINQEYDIPLNNSEDWKTNKPCCLFNCGHLCRHVIQAKINKKNNKWYWQIIFLFFYLHHYLTFHKVYRTCIQCTAIYTFLHSQSTSQ